VVHFCIIFFHIKFKKMKNGILFIVTLFTLFACAEPANVSPEPLMTYENNVLKVTIQSHHTKAELMELKDQLKNEFNVNLEFKELEFNSMDKIEKIKIAVESGRGESGSASSSNNLIFAPQVYFVIDFNPNASTSFLIGGGKKNIR